MTIRRIDTDKVYTSSAHKQMVEVTRPDGSRSIHLGAVVSSDVDRNLIGLDDMGLQVKTTLENVRLLLAEVGAGIEDIVRIKWYTLDWDRFGAEGGPVVREFFGEHLPCSTAVQVSRLSKDGALILIEVYAELDEWPERVRTSPSDARWRSEVLVRA